jgi:hypothetical protein
MSGKRPATFRLTEEARRVLTALAEKQGVSRTAILEILIRKAKGQSAAQGGKDAPHGA